MITRAKVIELVNNGYQAKVAIPIFGGSKIDKNGEPIVYNAIASICSMNNASNIIRVGDIVIVGFENEDIAKPIIIGQLFRPNIDLEGNIRVGLNLSTLSTTNMTRLSEDTYIGNVTPLQIQCLVGLDTNIKLALDNIKLALDELDERITVLENRNNQ